jgi:hypothetical protein
LRIPSLSVLGVGAGSDPVQLLLGVDVAEPTHPVRVVLQHRT